MEQTGKKCLAGEKPSHLSKISLALTWDLTWVGCIHSHKNDLYLESEIHYSTAISLTYPTQVGCLTSYKQSLSKKYPPNFYISIGSRKQIPVIFSFP